MQSERRPLRELCSLIADCPHSTPVWTDAGYIVVRNQNIKSGRLDLSAPSFTDAEHFAHRTRRAKPTSGDIIFTREAPMGEVCMVPPGLECCVGQRQVLLRPNPKVIDGRYLLFALQSPQVQHEIGWSEGTGSTVSNVRIPVLEALRIPTPPLAMQREVGAILGALDDRIDLLRQTNATLESIAQALFKGWFVDFDPVRAKAEGREPEGMDATTAALFPAELEEMAIGFAPQGWGSGSLADLAALNSASWSARRAPDEVVYVDLAGVKANVFDPPQRLAFADAPSRARRELRAGDTLVGTVRPGNRSYGYIAEAEPGLTGSTGFAVLSPVAAHAAAFVYLCATRRENIERLAALADGGAYPAVRPELVQATPCVLPPPVLMDAFDAVASPLLTSVAANTQRARLLVDTRDTLLPRLISGKLRLPEAQEQVEDALA